MASIMEIMQVCRLCLVKDQVNIPIFDEPGDIRQIFLKITACLPVKVSKEDNLPKKICDGCLYKLEIFYQFWNTTVNAEKQLLSWLSQAGMDANTKTTQEAVAMAQQQSQTQHSVKEEAIDPSECPPENADELAIETESYIMQQQQQNQEQQLPFESAGMPFEERGFNAAQESNAANSAGQENESDDNDEPLSKRRKRHATKRVVVEVPEPDDENEEDIDDPIDTTTVTKTEEESEESDGGDDNTDNTEPPNFVSMGSGDNEQPGPSGVGKVSAEAPFSSSKNEPHLNEMRLGKAIPCSDETEFIEIKRENQIDDMYIKESPQTSSDDNFDEEETNGHTNTIFIPETSIVEESLLWDSSADRQDFDPLVRNNADDKDDGRHIDCQLCGKVFRYKGQLAIHMRSHTKEKPYQCDICGKDFAHKCNLVQHANLHTGAEPYRSRYCNKTFSLSAYMRRHEMLHEKTNGTPCNYSSTDECTIDEKSTKLAISRSKAKPTCHICQKSFNRNRSLKEHLSSHTGEKLYRCSICNRGFNKKYSLKSHIMAHAGTKPHKCTLCEKAFVLMKHLKTHMLSHTGDKPHSCDVCGKRFGRKYSMNIHMRSHTGDKPFQCPTCAKPFSRKETLNVHMMLHIGKPFTCDICDKAFVTKYLLNHHMKKHACISGSEKSVEQDRTD